MGKAKFCGICLRTGRYSRLQDGRCKVCARRCARKAARSAERAAARGAARLARSAVRPEPEAKPESRPWVRVVSGGLPGLGKRS